jgi:uncharacterized protein YkwD
MSGTAVSVRALVRGSHAWMRAGARVRWLNVLWLLTGCAHTSSAGAPSEASETGTYSLASAEAAGDGAAAFPARNEYATRPPKGPVLLGRGENHGDTERTLGRACRQAGLEADPRLSELALALAQRSSGARDAPRGALVGYLAQRLGLPEPTPQLWLASASNAAMLVGPIEAAVLDAAQSQKLSHCGGAMIESDGMSVLAVAFSGRFFSLARTVPRAVRLGSVLSLDATLDAGYSRPGLAITAPGGLVTRVELPPGRAVRKDVRLDQPGEYQLEILAEGPAGVAVIAVFSVRSGDGPEAPAPAYQETEPETDVATFLAHLEELIGETRAERGLKPLKLDRRLSRIALAHSEDMDAHRFVAHTSKTTGEASDRLARAGLKARVLLENIGRGYSAEEIHDGLMASPGHRANILHPEAREMGLGAVMQREGQRNAFLVTQVFTELSR